MTTGLWTTLWTAAAAVLSVPVAVFATQVMVASGFRRHTTEPDAVEGAARPRVAVLMPAHDEEAGIATSIAMVLPQLQPGDRLLVVADNCSDATADVARAQGAEVVQRIDVARRGKGHALDFGMRHLALAPPDVVVFLDADCRLHAGALSRLVRTCRVVQRPVQALYLMRSPPEASLKTRVAEFAWRVKNQVRPLGFHQLGLPCLLMGSGMAFPWALIARADLASSHLVEDMQLGLALACAGSAPRFCPDALVTSVFPSSATALESQRTRWEHGHLGMIGRNAPVALWRAMVRRNGMLMAMTLDICVPPLTSLVLLLVAGWLAAAMISLVGGSALPWLVMSVDLALVGLAVACAWNRFGRDVISSQELLSVPLYMATKLPIYARLLLRRQQEWVRTKRDGGRS